MRLVTLRTKESVAGVNPADGQLAVVSNDGAFAVPSRSYPTLIGALEHWSSAEPYLQGLVAHADHRDNPERIALVPGEIMAPLPRTFSLLDGSAFIEHIIRVRKARNAEPPADLFNVPLMYQGAGDHLLGPHDDITLTDESWGLDYEGEVCVVLNEVPMGTSATEAPQYIRLFVLMNDLSLRNLIPRELAAGFGFFHGKPASSFSPFAITVDELGEHWRSGRVHLPLVSRLNGVIMGNPNAGEMHFSFFDLIEHAAKTRHLPAGTVLGSGTVSNKDESRGVSCLAEKRTLEVIHHGQATTPFLKRGDVVEIEMIAGERSLFGVIKQQVVG